AIEGLIEKGKLVEAEERLHQQVDAYFASGSMDSVVKLISVTGNLALKRYDSRQAIERVGTLVNRIVSMSPEASVARQTCIEASEFYGRTGSNQLAYNTAQKAYEYCLTEPKGNKP